MGLGSLAYACMISGFLFGVAWGVYIILEEREDGKN
jgi:hypothetical protein